MPSWRLISHLDHVSDVSAPVCRLCDAGSGWRFRVILMLLSNNKLLPGQTFQHPGASLAALCAWEQAAPTKAIR